MVNVKFPTVLAPDSYRKTSIKLRIYSKGVIVEVVIAMSSDGQGLVCLYFQGLPFKSPIRSDM